MKKKIFAVFMCLFAMLLFFTSAVCVSAAETSIEVVDHQTPSDEVPDPSDALSETTGAEAAGAESNETYHTIFTRIWEYVTQYQTETITIACNVVLYMITLFLELKRKKKIGNITKDLTSVKSKTKDTFEAQGRVVDATNQMVEACNKLAEEYKKLKESYDTYGATEGDRNRVIGALIAQNTTILEFLNTVYAGSKNLPQGLKDQLSIKYANCLKSLEDDQQLKAIVEAVRANINAGTVSEGDKSGSPEV